MEKENNVLTVILTVKFIDSPYILQWVTLMCTKSRCYGLYIDRHPIGGEVPENRRRHFFFFFFVLFGFLFLLSCF